ncbi:MAG TPA: DUF3800 domain-containing protein [Terriglobales bacterium]|nr:DUF3800 domain-containing protein [Terriglobales bacterium]
MMQPETTYGAYIDDSASSEDDEIFLLAGYAQTAPAWAAFSDVWAKTLRQAPSINYCHMTEAEGLKGQFLGWGKTQRDRKLAELANVIVKHDPWSIECFVSRQKYQEIIEPVIAYDLRGPYFSCFYGTIVSLARYHAQTGITLPTDFVFDEQGKVGAEAVLWYEAIKERQKPEIKALMGSTPIFRDDEKVLPLQAADMIAWHLRRRRESRNRAENREVMEILSSLIRVEVEISETALRQQAEQMASISSLPLVRGKRGSIKRQMVGGKLPAMVVLVCKNKECMKEFDAMKDYLAQTGKAPCPFCGQEKYYIPWLARLIKWISRI